MRFNKEYIIITCLLLFIIGVTFFELLNGNKVLISSDTLSPTAIKNGINNSIKQYSEFPLWTPWIFSGLPTTHSLLNISDYYYPHKLIILIKELGIPWIWNFLMHFIFGGLGMYHLLRYLNRSKYSSFIAS